MRMTVVEESPLVGGLVSFAARRRGHTVASLSRRKELFEALPFEPAAIAIASASNDDQKDAETVTQVRQRYPSAMVLLLTETDTANSRHTLMRAGAHEVVPTPFDPFELVLKTESWARDFREDQGGEKRIKVADLEVDADRYVAVKNGTQLTMTALELRILYCLCVHYPNMTPHERFLSFAWGSLQDPDASLIRTHICHIRKKLQDAGGIPVRIRSKHTLGYELIVESE